MADKRRGKQKRQQEEQEKPTKEEYAVAKFLRFNVPVKEGKLMGMSVQYFIASKGVDALMDSKWGSKAKSEPLFTSRFGCVDYCDRLLQKGIFHRALKLERTKKDKEKKRKKTKEEDEKEKEEEKKGKKDKKTKKGQGKEKVADEKDKGKDKENEEDSSKEVKEEKEKKEEDKEKKEEKKDEEKKKKRERKAKLEMHNSQVFKDGDEVYVWIYDPVPLKTFLIGLLLVLGAIAICLFPLWPPEVRLGIYYLSLVAAGFVGFILVLCIIRLILFCIVWAITFGRHYFWFLPNLTEDVGVFDSFKPLYHHERVDRSKSEDQKSDKSKAKTDKHDSQEDRNEEEGGDSGKEGSGKEESAKEESGKGDSEKEEYGIEADNDNGFEVVDPEELEGSEEGEKQDEEEEQEEVEPKKTK